MLTSLKLTSPKRKLLPAPVSTTQQAPETTSSKDIQEEVTDKFKDSYFDGAVYEPRFCGENIRRFASKLSKDALKSATVLAIKNAGVSYFGFVRATHVREVHADGTPRIRDKNWHYHVIMESEGSIYDFDHGIEPTVRKVDDYFDTMFFRDKDVKAQRKKDDYELEVFSGQDYLAKTEGSSSKTTLGEYLSSRKGVGQKD